MLATSGSDRDRFALHRDQLLSDYAAISARRRGSAEATALRIDSRDFVNILAFEASAGQLDWPSLRTILHAGEPPEELGLQPMVVGEIGRVLVLQQLEPDDDLIGIRALRYATGRLPVNGQSRKFRKLLVESFVARGEHAVAEELLDIWRDIDSEFYGYLRAESRNPFRSGSGDLSTWLHNFNRVFVAHDLAPVQLSGTGPGAFDQLMTAPLPSADFDPDAFGAESGDRRPIVSVVVTAYNPDRTELLTSLNSLLRQTLHDIEIIVVDDGSDARHHQTLVEVEELDPRLRLVRADRNGGTYRARNIGYRLARGRFVTGQDDDDWSHPQRLEEQVKFLLAHPEAAGCRVESVNCLADLSRTRLGYRPLGGNASSLMMLRTTFESSGGFLETRKAADTELHRRIEQLTGGKVVEIHKPLAVVRIDPDSLSRSDFRAGWHHPMRRSFRLSYSYWHNNAPVEELQLGPRAISRIHVPRRLLGHAAGAKPRFDVVLAGDWSSFGGPQKSMIEEIRALTTRGLAVGVLHLEAPRFMSKKLRPLTEHVQQLINEGVVHEVLYDDDYEVNLLILRYPPILQFALAAASRLRIKRMWILANQAPSELDGSDIRYLVDDCAANAILMFGLEALWVPQGPQVRAAISPYLASDALSDFDVPGVLDPVEWFRDRRHRRSSLAVIGRHSRDNAMKWPEDSEVLRTVYPTTGRFDVRVMGGASVPVAVLGESMPPAAWTVYATDALPVPAFLNSLDFYVFYQNSIAVEAFGRSILEAIASGAVVILPPHYKDVFGAAALYVEPVDVAATITRFHNDRNLYDRQVRAARTVVRDLFSHDAYANLIARELMEEAA